MLNITTDNNDDTHYVYIVLQSDWCNRYIMKVISAQNSV